MLLLVSASHTNSQVTQAWVQKYNGSGNSNDYGNIVEVDNTGNIYVTGQIKGATGNYDFCTIKYNSSGIKIWEQIYNGSGNGDDIPFSMVLDKVGNLYVTGRSYLQSTSTDYVTIKYNSAGMIEWIQSYTSNAGTDIAQSVAVDTLGNVYVTGTTGATIIADIATIKYSSSGVQQWVQTYGNSGYIDEGRKVVVDRSGNVYVGATNGLASGISDIVLIKYNSSGTLQWIQRYNGPGNDWDFVRGLALDSNGDIIISGGSTGIGTSTDYITIKYNPSGVLQWFQRENGSGNRGDNVTAMIVDNSNNIYVTGNSEAANGLSDFLTIKYSPSGSLLWSQRYNGNSNREDFSADIALDKSGNIYVSGMSIDTTTNFMGRNCATIKYNPAGAQQWIQKYNGNGNSNDELYSIAVDTSGGVYVTGYVTGIGTAADIVTIKYSQPIGIETISNEVPSEFSLFQNYPNPFNPVTNIKFNILKTGFVSIKVYDILGNEVETLLSENKPAGSYSVSFDGNKLSSGIYFYKINIGDFSDTKRMVLVK